jgi:hypothetical protein
VSNQTQMMSFKEEVMVYNEIIRKYKRCMVRVLCQNGLNTSSQFYCQVNLLTNMKFGYTATEPDIVCVICYI